MADSTSDTEDLFSWDNDLEKDSERRLHINTDSQFFKGLKGLALDERIGHYLARYADFLFDIDYDAWTVSFRKGVVGVDAQLVDDLEAVLAPVLDVDQGVVQRGAVVAGECFALTQLPGRGVDVGRDDVVQQAGELAVGQVDPVQGFELLAEVAFQRGAVPDVGAVLVLEALELADEAVLDVLFFDDGARCSGRRVVSRLGRRHGVTNGVGDGPTGCATSGRLRIVAVGP